MTFPDPHIKCPHCGAMIGPDICWCGQPKNDHGYSDNHGFIPMGCDCYRDKSTEEAPFGTGWNNDIQLKRGPTPMTTQSIYTDILTRLLMLLALLGLFLIGLNYAPEIAASLSARLSNATNITLPADR